MTDTRDYRIFCLSETLTPLTHMRGTAGNEALINREPVVCEIGTAWLPVLSANAIRHRMIREPGARYLVDLYRIGGHMSIRMLNFLFHGGSLTESNSRESTGRLAEIRDLLPLIRLLGASLPNQILPGLLTADRGTMVCRENRERIRAMLPDGWETPDLLPSAEMWVGRYQYTRGDASKQHPDMVDTDAEVGAGLMIYSGEQVNAGAMFVHGFRLQRATMAELGCLLWSLQLWADAGATIGGQASRGHGQLRTQLAITCDGDAPSVVDAIDAYQAHAVSVAERATPWLFERFGECVPQELRSA